MGFSRAWATPLVIGAFVLSAVTGILMFFHLDIGLNKLAHEWLSWLLVAGVLLHVLNNLPAFNRYFRQPVARWLMGGLLLVLLASFLTPSGTKRGPPPQVVVLRAAAGAPLTALALMAGLPVDTVKQRLKAAGLNPVNDSQNVIALVGPDRQRQMQVLAQVLAPP